jgi:hypothetical protein
MEKMRIKTPEEIQLEEELRRIRESTAQAREDLRKATEALRATEGGKKSILTKRNLGIALAAAIGGTGGFYGAKKTGEITGGLGYGDQNERAALELNYTASQKRGYYMNMAERVHEEKTGSSKINLPEQAAKFFNERGSADTNNPPKLIRRFKLGENTNDTANPVPADTNAAPTVVAEPLDSTSFPPPPVFTALTPPEPLKTRAAESASTNAPAAEVKIPTVRTAEEISAELRKKFEEKRSARDKEREAELKAFEASRTNEPARPPIKIEIEYKKPAKAPQPQEEQVREKIHYGGTSEGYWGGTSKGYWGGVGGTYAYGVGGQATGAPEIHVTKNYFGLSEEVMKKIELVHDHNLKKVFPDPDKALEAWMKVQNKNAHEMMNKYKKEEKVPKKHKLLWSYLKKLEKTSGLSPALDENILPFMERALQKIAKDGKLDEVVLK